MDRLVNLLRYDAATGDLFWCQGHPRAGHLAGRVGPDGYRRIRSKEASVAAHRVVWRILRGEWPALGLDHINGNRADNRIENLRLATPAQNNANMRGRGRHLKGVTKNGNRFQAQIKCAGVNHYIGLFMTEEEAHAAYLAKAIEFFGEFARAA